MASELVGGSAIHRGINDATLVVAIVALITVAPLVPAAAIGALAGLALLTIVAWTKRSRAATPLGVFCVFCLALAMAGVPFSQIVLGVGLLAYAALVRTVPWLRGAATWVRRGSFGADIRLLTAAVRGDGRRGTPDLVPHAQPRHRRPRSDVRARRATRTIDRWRSGLLHGQCGGRGGRLSGRGPPRAGHGSRTRIDGPRAAGHRFRRVAPPGVPERMARRRPRRRLRIDHGHDPTTRRRHARTLGRPRLHGHRHRLHRGHARSAQPGAVDLPRAVGLRPPVFEHQAGRTGAARRPHGAGARVARRSTDLVDRRLLESSRGEQGLSRSGTCGAPSPRRARRDSSARDHSGIPSPGSCSFG